MARSEKFWATARAAYRRGEGSIADLAKRFEVPQSTMEKRAHKEKWTQQRQEVGAKAEAKAVERDIDAKAKAIARVRAIVGGVLDKAAATLEAVDLFDPDGIGQVSSAIARMAPIELRLAGVDPDRPVVTEAQTGKARIVVRGGAALSSEPKDEPCPQ